MNETGHILIDPPVSAYSDPGEIRAWIRELEAMPDRPEVRTALDEAREMLRVSIERRTTRG